MLTTTPVEADAFRLLRDNLYEHLEEAEYLADAGNWSEAQRDSIRAVISDLVTIVRGLIAQHEAPKTAAPKHCQACGTAWPCPGFHTIYKLVKNPNGEFVKLIQARRPAPAAESATK